MVWRGSAAHGAQDGEAGGAPLLLPPGLQLQPRPQLRLQPAAAQLSRVLDPEIFLALRHPQNSEN